MPILPNPVTSSSWTQNRQYGIVIDAGSSGSRIQVYSWIKHDVAREERQRKGLPINVMPNVETGVPNGGDGWHSRVEPGISSFGAHPAQIDNYLAPLLDHALSIIPPEKVASTPLFLLATAGMRLLPEDQQQAVLSRACKYMRSHYNFDLGPGNVCATSARIISGEEEGLFGWIAVNYLMDGFDHHEDHDSVVPSGRKHSASTYGFLDMGGASTQIAFEPSPKEQEKHSDNLTSVKLKHLDGRTLEHPVFVTTWLGYGTNKARERYVDAAIASYAGESSAIKEPAPVIGHEVVPRVLKDPCLPKSLLLSEAKHKDVMLQGTGDFETCVRITAPLLNKNAPCLDEPCLFNGVHAPAIDFSVNHFIGISEYWYSTNDVFSMGGVYDFVAFEKSAMQFCSKEWDAIVEAHEGGTVYKSTMDLSRLEMQCFKAAWIVNILHEGIGVPRIIDSGGKGDGKDHVKTALLKADDKGFADTDNKGTPSFQSVDQVGDIAISWTLGKMVLEVSQSIDRQADAEIENTWLDEWHEPIETAMNTLVQPKPRHYGPIMLVVLLLLLLFRRKTIFAFFRRRTSDDNVYSILGMEEGQSNFTKSDERNSLGAVSRLSSFLGRLRRKLLPTPRSNNALPLHATSNVRPGRSLRHAASSPNLNVYERASPRQSASETFGESDLASADRFMPLKQTQSSSSLSTLGKQASNRSRRHFAQGSDDFASLQLIAASDAASIPDPIQRSVTPTLSNRNAQNRPSSRASGSPGSSWRRERI